MPIYETGIPLELPIGRAARSLPTQVADHLLEAIITGRLAPGTRLRERTLAEEHAVSRATIREALIWLEKSRFIERVPRFGARVTAIGIDDINDLFELRGILLGSAARRCAQDPAPDFLAALADCIQKLWVLTGPDDDPQQFGALSLHAQHLLLSHSGNRYMLEVYQHLADIATWRIVRRRALSHQHVERRVESAADWDAVLSAISLRDGDAADNAARTVLRHSARGMRGHLGRPDGLA